MSATRVLIVDDDDAVCRTARWAIESITDCDVAHDVQSACSMLERERYELVLIDVRLPGASGLTLLDTLRARWPAVAALMISGLDDLDVARDALARGALAYVVKPLRVNDLRIHVASVLELARRSPATVVASARARVESTLASIRDRAPPDTCLVVEIEQPSLLDATYGPGALAHVQQRVIERVLAFPARIEVLGEIRPGVLAATLTSDGTTALADTARNLHERLSRPVALGEHNVPSSLRLGFAACAPPEDAATVICRAEEAANSAREHQRGFAVSETGDWSLARDELGLLADLKLAIDAQSLDVAYQPQVDLETGTWIGLEALVRWHHPVRGDIPPAVLVPLAERAGFMDLVGAHVLRRACRDLAALSEMGVRSQLRVAVNVSTSQLRDERFEARVAAILAETRTDPSRLCLEITESLAIDESDAIDARLRALNDSGITLSIDDFGTGYSSFSLLHRAPWGEIKIDRSITALLGEPSAVAIVRSLIALGHARDLDVLAEGVETERESRTLRTLGCRYAQGFWFAYPAPLAEIATRLRSRSPSGGRLHHV